MRKSVYFTLILLSLVILTAAYLYSSGFFHEKIYIRYSNDPIYNRKIDWSMYSNKFPNDLKPESIPELPPVLVWKIEKIMAHITDSVISERHYPAKFIEKNKNKKRFGIEETYLSRVLFRYNEDDVEQIDIEDIKKIRFSSVEHILSKIELTSIGSKGGYDEDSIMFYIIYYDNNDSTAQKISVRPVYEMID